MVAIGFVALVIWIGAVVAMWHEVDIAPMGYEDDDGFHYGEKK